MREASRRPRTPSWLPPTVASTNKADHYFLWLWEHVPPIEAFDLLMTVAIPKNVLDDHYFIFPAFTWRALESIGQEYLPILMRPAVRYVTRFPIAPGVPEIEALIEEHQLLTRVTRQHSGEDETAVIGRVGEAIGRCDVYADIPVLLAKALADGLSLEGAGEALSIGAAGLFLRSLTGNPMDVHLHTSANLRRYLIGLDGLSLKNKLLVLLLWHTGPEIRSTARRMVAGPATGSGGSGSLALSDARRVARGASPRAFITSHRPTGPRSPIWGNCAPCRKSKRPSTWPSSMSSAAMMRRR